MARKTGVTKNTVRRIVMDSGVVYFNLDDPATRKKLGATRGGSEFVVEQEYRDMPFDGVGGFVKGSRRIISTTASLTVNLVEIHKDILKVALPGATYDKLPSENEGGIVVSGETHYELKRKLEETIPDFEYTDVAIVAEYAHHKSPAVFGLKNAMANGNLSVSFNDADEAVLSITFTGALDPENIAEEPWFIRIPEKESAT